MIKKRFKGFFLSLHVKHKFYKGIGASARVLDMGCGRGRNGAELKAILPSVELHGMDISEEMKEPEIYSFKIVDLDKGMLPYPDEYFDALLFTHVIEHLRYPFGIGKEINRVMKKGARIYIETPNWTSILVPSFGFHREQHNPFNFYDDPTHIKPWSKHGLYEFISQGCHLQVERVGKTRIWLRVPFDFFIIPWGLVTGNRQHVVTSFWNLYGWCIYGVGVKE